MNQNLTAAPLSVINQQILDGFRKQHDLWAHDLISTDDYCAYLEANESKFSEELYSGHIWQTLTLVPDSPKYQRLFAIHSRIMQSLTKDLVLRINENAKNSM